MRLGYDAKRLYNNFTGLGNYSRTLVSNLLHYYPGEEYFLYTTKLSSDASVNKFLNNKSVITRQAQTPFRSLWRSYSIVRNLKEDRIDLYHGLSGEIPFGISKSNIKSLVTIHDLIFLVYAETYKAADRFLYDRKFRYACNNSDKIVAVSKSTKDDLIKYYGVKPSKISVIYQACDPIFYSDRNASDTKTVVSKYNLPKEFLLYVGSVIPRKNLLTVIKAIAILPPQLRVPVVVVGDGGKYKKEVKSLIYVEKLEKKILWIEDLHDSTQLKALYTLASAFIYPSLYEGFGIPVAEALLSKVPVITSNRSSLPEVAGENSILVDPESVEEILDGIEKVMTDTSLREKMITEGFRYASEKFSSESTSSEMYRLYSQILS